MQSIENALRAYVKCIKVDNTKNMQSHIALLIKLSRVAKTEMLAEQHQQHMAYIKNVTALQHSFEKLANAQDKAQKIRLFKEIKMNIKMNHLFR